MRLSPRTRRLGCWTAGGLLCAAALPAASAVAAPDDPAYEVLVFSKTAGFRHDSIDEGVAALTQLGSENNFAVTATEDATAFTADNLAQYEAVVFLSTTGDVLNEEQQTAFEGYIEGGGGYVGIHAAADTEYDWPFYGELAGAWFDSHPAIQEATVQVEDHEHDATAHLDDQWVRTDEWYNYQSNPRSDVHVLASLDETSYEGGGMDGDHPIAWCQNYEGGRSFYTGLGHTEESYTDPDFLRHVLGGIRWTAGVVEGDCGGEDTDPEPEYTPIFDGTAASLEGWSQAGPGSFVLDEEEGTITSQGGMGLFWYAADEYNSYSLKLDWRMEGDSNSGVFVGFPASDDPWSAVDNGYEIQIDATDDPDKTTGSVYDFQSADLEARDEALNPPGEWNSYELRVEGERIQVYLNGTLINDFTNTDPARSLLDGYIGLQNHSDADVVSFRDVRIAELPSEPDC